MKRCLLVLFAVLITAVSHAQGSDADEGDASADMMIGAGVSNEGVAYGGCVEMNAFGITLGARGSIHGGSWGFSNHSVKEFGILAGYGCSKESFSISVTGGYSLTSFKCISPAGYNCEDYRQGSYAGLTAQIKMTRRFSERTGLGFLGFGNFNRHGDLYGAMLMFDIAI